MEGKMLMDGVKVLSENTVNDGSWFLGVLLIFMTVVVFILTFVLFYEGELGSGGVAFLVAIILTLFTVSCFTGNHNYKEYKVTISDKVNFKEFNNTYAVDYKEGEIYTIRLKQSYDD